MRGVFVVTQGVGWFGHARQFDMATHYEPRQGIARYLCGTQPLASLAMVECGLAVFAQTSPVAAL